MIDPTLAQAVRDVTIPGDGHVQLADSRTNSHNPHMVNVGFQVCTPATGKELRQLTEDIAINLSDSLIGPRVAMMRIRSLPETTAPESDLRDHDFQLRTAHCPMRARQTSPCGKK